MLDWRIPSKVKDMQKLWPRAMIAVGLLALLPLWLGCTASAPTVRQVIFERSGGFAGLSDRLTIDLVSGQTILQQPQTKLIATLSTEQRLQLQQLLRDLDLRSLTTLPEPSYQCCDLLTYQLSIDTTTIQFTDTSLPSSLEPLVTALHVIITDMIASQTSA